MKALAVAFTLLLAGCGDETIDPARRASAEALLRRQFAPGPAPHVIAMWYASDGGEMLCGETEAPPPLQQQQSTLRFINFGRDLYLEPHLIGVDAVGQQISRETASTFASSWTRCAESAPIGRRVAAWFQGAPEGAPAATPLTNAYIDETLARAR